MQTFEFPIGRDRWSLECDPQRVLPLHRAGTVSEVNDPRAAVAYALEHPLRYEPLRSTLTSEYQITIVLDERLPHLLVLLSAVLEHLVTAGVDPAKVTVLTPPGSRQNWLDDLPDEYQDLHVERHDPTDRKRLSYIASSDSGRRIYLNRTLVESDTSIVLSGRSYDPLHGYGGCESFLYPLFADAEAWQNYASQHNFDAPGKKFWPARQDAVEAAWFLGEPFMVQVIEAPNDTIAAVIAGRTESSQDGQRVQDGIWRAHVDEQPEIVIATLSGDPLRHDFLDLARALACAARIVEREGRIVLLTEAEPHLGDAATILQKSGGLRNAIRRLIEQHPIDMDAAFQWASAAEKSRLFLHSKIEDSIVESMFAAPVANAAQVQRVMAGTGKCAFIPDAHKMMVTVGV